MRQTKKRVKNITQFQLNSKILGVIGIVILIIIIPLTVLRSETQTNLLSSAAPSTSLSFSKSSVQANVGDPITLDVQMNPGSNAVSTIVLVLNYDSSIVTPASNGFVPAIIPGTNPPVPFGIFDGPTYNTCTGTQCTMSVTLFIGNDFTKAVKIAGTIATVNLQAAGNTTQGPMQLAFDPTTTIYSIAAGDSSGENVLLSSTPSVVTIGNGATNTITPSAIPSATPTSATTGTPIPNPTGATPPTRVTVTPNPSITGKPKPSPTPTGTNTCDDDSMKKRDKDITAREKKENIREHNEQLKEQLVKSIIQQAMPAQTGKGHGACLGAFDPNNPDKNINCGDTSTIPSVIQQTQNGSSPSLIQSVQNFFGSLFR